MLISLDGCTVSTQKANRCDLCAVDSTIGRVHLDLQMDWEDCKLFPIAFPNMISGPDESNSFSGEIFLFTPMLS